MVTTAQMKDSPSNYQSTRTEVYYQPTSMAFSPFPAARVAFMAAGVLELHCRQRHGYGVFDSDRASS